jgi:hypothetical protein
MVKSLIICVEMFRSFDLFYCHYTPNNPRIQVTICCDPKTNTMPTMTLAANTHDIRPNQANAPATMTAITATGVKMVNMSADSVDAPDENGPAANVSSGMNRPSPVMVINAKVWLIFIFIPFLKLNKWWF